MSEENEVPSDEDVAREIIYKDAFFKQYSEIVPEVGERLERYVFDIRDALSALRASWEKKVEFKDRAIQKLGDTFQEEIKKFEAEKKGLEERVRKLESLKILRDQDKEIYSLMLELNGYKTDRMASVKLIENLQAERDTLTCALSEAREALGNMLNQIEVYDVTRHHSYCPDYIRQEITKQSENCICDQRKNYLKAQDALSNPTSQRASEEMKRLREIEARMKGLEK